MLLHLDSSVLFMCNVISDWKKWILKIKWWSDVSCIKLSYVIDISIIYIDFVLFICFVIFLVITHSLYAICVWIMWWSRILCSWEQMTRWTTLKNLVPENVGTQRSDKMCHWGWVFILISWCYFILFYLTDLTKLFL